ncbi:hypothetical protein CBR_g24053 [Chara braunii]|uniref:ER membrane protein complex subunit 7 beta-sandwich domain-containing protein n=1 Tax=Chara braunii TaxID=69332 RepID=A0A388L5M5_CHABU|nr:hypothetical protein CBR_g24053 [Chara braunii]|eukprot:GBG77607.1 hypothetical protein CBR_g24053 [Chara braunii]
MAASRKSRRRGDVGLESLAVAPYCLWLCILIIVASFIGATYASYPTTMVGARGGRGGGGGGGGDVNEFDSRASQSRVGRRGFNIHGRIWIEKMPTVKISQVKLVLDGGERVTFLKQEGFFSFLDVPVGIHLLEVVAMGYMFVPVRIDVSPRYEGNTRAMWTDETTHVKEGMMVLHPLQPIEYYEKREPFSVSGMLKNPMVLMVLFMVVAMFLLPKLVENMDPEAMRELQQEMTPQPAMAKVALGKDS